MSLRFSIFESAAGTTGFAFGMRLGFLGVLVPWWCNQVARAGMNHEDAKGTKLWGGRRVRGFGMGRLDGRMGRTDCGLAWCWGSEGGFRGKWAFFSVGEAVFSVGRPLFRRPITLFRRPITSLRTSAEALFAPAPLFPSLPPSALVFPPQHPQQNTTPTTHTIP